MVKNKEKLATLDTKVEAVKKELDTIKKQQLLYYHALLSEGADFRQEGLIWIIKVIWQLGANVILTKLPRFLDEKSIEFLFRVIS